ncbi:type III toxin-antitoxin system ToxN/AbiQ family toxin [Listeria monocytogenes]|uniref:type III toxin-antitoxin system ToxN/AbiQ family toxin n=1 Tax=Listeria TaxID=1637 RepID=UPI0015EFCB06|nr:MULTISPECIES: type III toxin-antitoxin system ToxN/AbiQ family toxin [Listeria]EIL7880425.1 type III toxin-antitoxin system ToxN/AbiQ family toxin [Listeria monocytogenes]EIL8091455.1 type III toxin-antitoxin system ToxN/AbiQ family toxin [Listeria monocytogenes]EIN2031117.1 type III toxin-antitoxin system ToxN/AbiQ family toxin [Listeria monocytogenes]MDA5977102.1 type III toxin-antitoxin system ToxN/AbiQ family toxin [Listeria monocytogenes]MDA5992155.1 type III toxin-antitoxin system Tox
MGDKDYKFSFYTITDEYIGHLREFDKKVHHQYEDNASTYVGIVLRKNGFNYFVPLSSFSVNKDEKMKKRSQIVIRLFEVNNEENPLGYMLFNNMIPVPDSELINIQLDMSVPKHKMMLKQLVYMKTIGEKIENKADLVYRKVVEEEVNYFLNFCCDFRLLEAKAILYKKNNS